MLRSFELEERELDQDDPWNVFVHACAFCIRSTFHTSLQASPGKLVCGRDMIHDVGFQANWDRIKNNKQKIIPSSNKRENLNGIKHNYNAGDHIITKTRSTAKVIGSQGGTVYYIRSWDNCNDVNLTSGGK
jgi:hypothetical protein